MYVCTQTTYEMSTLIFFLGQKIYSLKPGYHLPHRFDFKEDQRFYIAQVRVIRRKKKEENTENSESTEVACYKLFLLYQALYVDW